MIVGPEHVEQAAEVLRRGGLVAFPTETVYGLGADASNADAVKRIFAAKGRPADHPLIVHLSNASDIDRWAVDVPPAARVLAARCWPGPLTMVLGKAPWVPPITTGGLDTIGLRVPNQALALSLLRAFGGGVAAPSANRFGRVSPTRPEDVAAELDSVELILDGGPCRIGVESTILDLTVTPAQILRPGGVSADELEEILGMAVARHPTGPARAPGMLEVHYAPSARVELVDASALALRAREWREQGERVGVIVPADVEIPAGVEVLGVASSAEAYAHALYAWLRSCDARQVTVVLAVPPSEAGIGAAVRDRLRRAAAGDSPRQDRG